MVSIYYYHRASFVAGIMLNALYGFNTNNYFISSASCDRETEAHGDYVLGGVLGLRKEREAADI